MPGVDLNLLTALDALLSEGSVTGAGRRLGLSASAMSRTLARLRTATGDPLLVRAGRALVPTPHARALGERVRVLAEDARAVLRPAPSAFLPDRLVATFTIRASEAFLDLLAAPLVASVHAAAPGVRLRFAPKPDQDARLLREGTVDLEIGVVRRAPPETRTRVLFRDSYVGVARMGHPLLDGTVSPARYAACEHVVASRDGLFADALDEALGALGLTRRVVAVVPGYPDAMRIVRGTDLVGVVPRSSLGGPMGGNRAAELGLSDFDLGVSLPEIAVHALWHPRLDADAAHRWLRDKVATLFRERFPDAG